MLRCPKCGDEFREGFSVCTSCNEPLVEIPDYELPSGEELDDSAAEAASEIDSPALLVSVNTENEVDLIKSMLNSQGIPVYVRQKLAGDFMQVMMGYTNFGADIFVPSDQLSKAKELLYARPEQPEGSEYVQQETETEMTDLAARRNRFRRTLVWLVIGLLILIPLLVSFIVNNT